MIDEATQRSGELFDAGYHCAEAVLLAMAEALDIQSDLIPKMATGFSTGIATAGGQCGALSGAILGINLVSGRNSPQEPWHDNYAMVKKLVEKFEHQFRSRTCQVLVGCDLGTKEGRKVYDDNNLIQSCKVFTREAARMAMTLIVKSRSENMEPA